MRAVAVALVVLLALTAPSRALAPGEMLTDPALEARARAISAELRCLVCQNQSIDDSDADLARELRLIVRERLVAGDSDEAVRQYLVARYGEFVLLRPVLAWHTLALWVAAPVVLLGGGVALVLVARRRTKAASSQDADSPLSDDERAALARLENGPANDPKNA